ncbi:hypothetical protein Afil01_28030 [Actinorhabdospora filicis]|uniref:Uncharacterized protein n=1 Tax=Actinorhabdospora filicis TaxID=1785913 RepID=A0A9W6SNT6_9ACTN|nr:hypothetical protein [Actinorhabdospora filicis]GLZ77996.1 hypothetical protein Afil01_28030 [Actinorhabdospora filicis]
MHPVPAAEAVWSRHGGRRHALRLLLGVALFAVLTLLLVNAFRTGDFEQTAEKVIGGVMTCGCALLCLGCAYAAATLPRRAHLLPGVAVDATGVWWLREGRLQVTLWDEIGGVGVGYLRAPRLSDSLRIKENYALEVYLRHERPDLAAWHVDEPPQGPRLRYVLLAGGDRRALETAVGRFAPGRWIGEYERRWTRLGPLGK